jgi:nucleotide-binding universal stress UspA family protein
MSSSVASERPQPSESPIVVVGVDGSEASNDALVWAARYVSLIGGQLHAVAVWEWPASLGMALPLPDNYSPLDDADAELRKTVAQVLGDGSSIPVFTEVREGSPPYSLVSAAADAALLVVGSRGRGGFTGLLLGSTSEHCVRHAPCPVVVVRHQPAKGDE